jgi:hypothetical protein
VNQGNNYFKIENLSNLPTGNYLLQLFSEGEKIVQKIVRN